MRRTPTFNSCCDCRWAQRANLGDSLRQKLPGVVAATIEVYNTIRAELLPTPAKSHYLYNMRDLSKLFQVLGEAGSLWAAP